MEGWLEWFEERCAILEFDAGMSRAEAEATMVIAAQELMAQTGDAATDLMHSRYATQFYNPQKMIRRETRDVEVDEYRWRFHDMQERITSNWYSEEEAHAVFGDRWHERVDETRRVGKRAVY